MGEIGTDRNFLTHNFQNNYMRNRKYNFIENAKGTQEGAFKA